MTSLLNKTNREIDRYDFILVIINWLTKMIYYKLVKITINVHRLIKVIIDMVVWQRNFSELIIINKSLFLN